MASALSQRLACKFMLIPDGTRKWGAESAVRDRIGKGHNPDIAPLSGIVAKLKAQQQALVTKYASVRPHSFFDGLHSLSRSGMYNKSLTLRRGQAAICPPSEASKILFYWNDIKGGQLQRQHLQQAIEWITWNPASLLSCIRLSGRGHSILSS